MVELGFELDMETSKDWFVNPSYMTMVAEDCLAAYFNQKYDIISMVPWLHGQPSYYTGSLEVAQQLLSNEGRLNKPRKLSSPFLWVPFGFQFSNIF